jgi:hypothetical protein
MTLHLLSCIECPRCHTRYIVGASPYRNGSYVSSHPSEGPDVHSLYCSCTGRFGFFLLKFKSSELKTYSVSEWAHARGFGSPDEIVVTDTVKKAS